MAAYKLAKVPRSFAAWPTYGRPFERRPWRPHLAL